MEKTRKIPYGKISSTLQYTALIALGILVLLQAFTSLSWRMEEDTPLLHYAALLMDKYDCIPYRDFFETSMPGTFVFHYLIGSVFGYGDLAFRIVDLTLLGVLLAATYVFMSRFGRVAAIWGAVIFALVYFSRGQIMSLQRDYIGLIIVGLTLPCIPSKMDTGVRLWRFALVGVLFGFAALIKPHLAIALPVIFGALFAFQRPFLTKYAPYLMKSITVCVASFFLPIIIAIIWLIANSAFVPFTSILFDYLPLHCLLDGSHEYLSGYSRIRYLLKTTFLFGGYSPLLLCSLFAYYITSTDSGLDKPTAISLICVIICTALYIIYPTLAGKFWDYHYMPLAYFCCISTGLCLFERSSPKGPDFLPLLKTIFLILILLVGIHAQVNIPRFARSSVAYFRPDIDATAPKGGRVDEMACWLKARLRPGDTVQPLDWTGGSLHAMLLSKSRLATRFMYDYHFYHHTSSPFIQGLRKEFLSQLRNSPPRFVIDIKKGKPGIPGVDPERSFPELYNFLKANYYIINKGDGYDIYERIRDVQ